MFYKSAIDYSLLAKECLICKASISFFKVTEIGFVILIVSSIFSVVIVLSAKKNAVSIVSFTIATVDKTITKPFALSLSKCECGSTVRQAHSSP